jgi:septal ring factor EnvC (AmiA/AmiB activator)
LLALHGKQVGFEKVLALIDNMVELLKKEQVDDDSKKEYCGVQFDSSDDKKKALERTVSDTEAAISKTEEGIQRLTEEIAALHSGIKELDSNVATATEQRQKEHEEYQQLLASNNAAKQLLNLAKNRLNKFYNPKMYKEPAKKELSAQDRIATNMGAMLVQVSAHAQRKDAPAPPPETFDGAYGKKSEESNGVMGMIDLLIKDLDKEITEAETEEKSGQTDYETLMKDSAAKRTQDSKSLTDKEASKAELRGDLESQKSSKASTTKELMATLEYTQSLHAECDWLLQNFDARKEARTGEIDSLKKAKAVLSGASFSLLETRASRAFLERRA